MPRNSSGTYTLPNAPVVTGTTIDSADENDTRDDLASEMTNSLDRGGRGAMTAALKIVDGSAASPGVQFSSDANNGWYRNSADNWSGSAGSVEVVNFSTNGMTLFSYRLTPLSPAQITSNQNDYAPASFSTASMLRLDTDAARDLTGLAGGTTGRVIDIHYIGATTLTLKDESASSTAANRFALPADLVLGPDMSVRLVYDGTTSRWRMNTGAVSSVMVPVTMASSLTAARTTLDAAQLTSSLTEDTAPDVTADFLHGYDTSAAAEKKALYGTVLGLTDVASVGKNFAGVTNTTTQFTFTADNVVLFNASGQSMKVSSVSQVIDMTVSGAGGLDTGSEASNTWYYAWIIARADGTKSGVFSTSSSAPTMPSGYTYKALVGAVRNDGSSNLLGGYQKGRWFYFSSNQSVLGSGSSTSEATVSVSSFVPAIATQFQMLCSILVTSDGVGSARRRADIRFVTGVNYTYANRVHADGASGSAADARDVVCPNVSQQFFYIISSEGGGTSAVAFDAAVNGFALPIGGQ